MEKLLTLHPLGGLTSMNKGPAILTWWCCLTGHSSGHHFGQEAAVKPGLPGVDVYPVEVRFKCHKPSESGGDSSSTHPLFPK